MNPIREEGSSEEYGYPTDSRRSYVRPHIIRRGHYEADFDAPIHSIDRSFRKRADDCDSERDLVGAIDGNEDWATSLQKEEKSIQKEDQKVE